MLEVRLFGAGRRRERRLRPAVEQGARIGKRRGAVAQVERRGAEPEHVGAPIERLAAQRFGRHEAHRAAGVAGDELPDLLGHGDAEVAELGAELRRAEEVGRLDVAVQDAVLVRGVQRPRDIGDGLAHEPQR